MSRYVLLCTLLVLIKVVASIPNGPAIVDLNSEEDSSDNGSGDSSEEEDDSTEGPSKVIDLFSSSQLNVVPSPEIGGIVRYTIGKRTRDDRLVGRGTDSKEWPKPQDVTLALIYPTSGEGEIISSIDIYVNRSSNIGQVYIESGGIGKRSFKAIVEAKRTTWFSYDAEVYGF